MYRHRPFQTNPINPSNSTIIRHSSTSLWSCSRPKTSQEFGLEKTQKLTAIADGCLMVYLVLLFDFLLNNDINELRALFGEQFYDSLVKRTTDQLTTEYHGPLKANCCHRSLSSPHLNCTASWLISASSRFWPNKRFYLDFSLSWTDGWMASNLLH